MWGLGIWLNIQRKSWKGKNDCCHIQFQAHPFYFLTHPHIHHTYFLALPLSICLLQAWLTSGGHKLILIWMYKMEYYVEFAMCSWEHSSPVINCMYSKCGIWECVRVSKTEKESKHFIQLPPHFLTHPQIHHTHILSYHSWFACYRFDRLMVPIVLSYNWNIHKTMFQKVTVVHVWGQSLPVLGHPHLQTRKGTSPIVEESFAM